MNMHDKNFVDNFVESLEFKGECKNLAKVLLVDENDCREFYISYYGKNAYAVDDLLDYREKKIVITDISFERFASLYDSIGLKKALEKTFLRSFSVYQVSFIERLISAGEISLKEIHSLFISKPNENILKYVL